MIQDYETAYTIAIDRANRTKTLILILSTANGYLLSSLAFLPQLYAEYTIIAQEEVWPTINDMYKN